MIGVRQAVTAAREFAGVLLDEEKLAGITLEEVELSPDERHWLVTLGFPAVLGVSGSTPRAPRGSTRSSRSTPSPGPSAR